MSNNSTNYEPLRVKQSLFSNLSSQSLSVASPLYNRQSAETYSQDSPSIFQTRNSDDNNKNFKVVVRVRPPVQRELESDHFISTTQVNPDSKRISIYEYFNAECIDAENAAEYLEDPNMHTVHNFTFDRVYSDQSTQAEVYEGTAQPAVTSVLKGYNATILAYGQTGTGKTFTMDGFKFGTQDPQRGIIPRSMEDIFRYIENVSNSKTTFMVRVSYLQIYNEQISDLLRTDRSNLHIREDKKKGVFVEGLSEWPVRSPNDTYGLIQKGTLARATAATRMNDMSSRSHAVFIIIVEQMTIVEDENTGEEHKEIRVGKLNLVDLAGSERVRVTGATGKRLEECKKINQSLSALGNVISALADQKQGKTHIPYRDAKITRLLEDSLGGNCITTMMAMISPSVDSFGESLSTLKFANRAKNIKNDPIINEDLDQKALLRKYETELKTLRGELEERSKTLIDKKKVTQLEEDKRRAEQDKVAAFEALEVRSREFLQMRDEKKKLEEKIANMNSQMIVGGRKVEETLQFRTAVEEQQKSIRQQYDLKLQDIERERQQIEEDKAQVDRYKQLLLKQRDIMIALTTRLNERDETIVQLQEELDAYDRVHKQTEDLLEARDRRVLDLENALRENSINLPKETPNKSELILQNLRSYNPDVNDEQRVPSFGGVDTSNVVIPHQMINDQRNMEMIENLEFQLQSMTEVVRKAEDQQNKLKDSINQKDDLIKRLQQQLGSSSPNDENMSSTHIEIKKNVDSIIESLSSQNNPQRLQNVARDLLNLQKLVNSFSTFSNAESKAPEKLVERQVNRNEGARSSETPPTGVPVKTAESESPVKRSAEKQERQKSVNAVNRTTSESEQLEAMYQQAIKHTPAKSISGETAVSTTPRGKEQSQSAMRTTPAHPSPIRGSDSKRNGENKSGENKRSISTGIFGKYMGNLVNLEPERKPMTVEEMLKMKRDQPALKKK